MDTRNEYIYLEIDGKILLVNDIGVGPQIPKMGRRHKSDDGLNWSYTGRCHFSPHGFLHRIKWHF